MSVLLQPTLYDGQTDALDRLSDGKILCGGVGSGKSIVGLAYWARAHSEAPLRIITTAAKRDSLEWWGELARFGVGSISAREGEWDIKVDSWNNIAKYTDEEGCFFIFDEQRLVGNGAWVKAFYKIAKRNDWIVLSATPGDVWMDYVPMMVANGYYKNKTDFTNKHVVWNPYTKFPSVLRYTHQKRLRKIASELLVMMEYRAHAVRHVEEVPVSYSAPKIAKTIKNRWNPFTDQPIQNAGELCYTLRKITNMHTSRYDAALEICRRHDRVIIFYSFDYELEILQHLEESTGKKVYARNGHTHDPVPDDEQWIYLVNYMSGAEAWNCVRTNVMIFYSLSYSWKTMEQAEGRIDRRNTPYRDLYYYRLVSGSCIDQSIKKALANKKVFNQRNFAASLNKGEAWTTN